MPDPTSFAYLATTASGEKLTGTLVAADIDAARRQLESLALKIDSLTAVPPVAPPPRGKPLSGEQFISFNQQLAQLTRAGLPIEQGLRLIAEDLQSGRLADAAGQVADDLARGQSLAESFDRRRSQFPPLYGRLIDAGVQTNNLPAMLFNLGRHLELVGRLKASLWRALSYPLVILVAIGVLMTFLGLFVLPKTEAVFKDFRVELPAATQFMLDFSRSLPAILIIAGALVAALLVTRGVSRFTGVGRGSLGRMAMGLPLIGPILKRNLIARWCDALQLAVQAGLDLPAALDLAGRSVDSLRLRSDGERLCDALAAGRSLDDVGKLSILPATVPAALHLGTARGNLPETLATLTEMYQQQAELRMAALPAILTPLLTILFASIIGFVITAMFMPIIMLLRTITGGPK